MVLVPVGMKRVGIQQFADLAVNVGRQNWLFLPRNAALCILGALVVAQCV